MDHFVRSVQRSDIMDAMSATPPGMAGRTQLEELLHTWTGLCSNRCYHVAWTFKSATHPRLEATATLMVAGALECRISQVIVLIPEAKGAIQAVRIRRPRMIAQGSAAAWLPLMSMSPDLDFLARLEQILDDHASQANSGEQSRN